MVIFVLSGVCLSSAPGALSVDWRSDAACAASVFLADQTTMLPAGSIVQLIYSTSSDGLAEVDPVDPFNPEGLVATITSIELFGMAMWHQTATSYELETTEKGFLYQRVFNWTDIGDTDGIEGTAYRDSLASSDIAEADTTQPYRFAAFDSTEFGDGEVYYLNQTVIPEPSTIALAFAGIGFFVVRKIRSRNKKAA